MCEERNGEEQHMLLLPVSYRVMYRYSNLFSKCW